MTDTTREPIGTSTIIAVLMIGLALGWIVGAIHGGRDMGAFCREVITSDVSLESR